MDFIKTIFCVEDDENIRELLSYSLSAMNFTVNTSEDYEGFYEYLKTQIPNLVLLDIMLPKKDGIQILKELRGDMHYKDIPVIMLTAKTQTLDIIKGLDNGADDYISKPFDIMELLSRINAVLRRKNTIEESSVKFNHLIVDPQKRTVISNGKNVVLTYKEFELLSFLLLNRDIVLTRDKIMNSVWGTDFEGETRTVDVHIRTLRQKLGDGGNCIETVRNVGYKISDIAT